MIVILRRILFATEGLRGSGWMRTAAREVLVDLSRRNLFLLFELLNRSLGVPSAKWIVNNSEGENFIRTIC